MISSILDSDKSEYEYLKSALEKFSYSPNKSGYQPNNTPDLDNPPRGGSGVKRTQGTKTGDAES